MARIIDKEQYSKLYNLHCAKGKHRFRENSFGITFCTICGLLSTKPCDKNLLEEEKLIIR